MLHWREYLAEALGLGLFMVSAGLVAPQRKLKTLAEEAKAKKPVPEEEPVV